MVSRVAVDGTAVELVPVSAWDLYGGGSQARSWRYRLDFIGPTGSMTETLPADAVTHFRVGVDARTPWKGQAPLRRSPATAELAALIELSLANETRLPVTRLVPFQLQEGGYGTAQDVANKVRQGGLVFYGDRQKGERETVKIGPHPDAVMAALRTDAGRDICAAFGVPPALFEARGDGSGQREAWRRFWAGTVQPLAATVQAELRAKLDPMAVVNLDAMRASDEDGRSRAVARRAQAFKVLKDSGISRGRAMRIAGLEG